MFFLPKTEEPVYGEIFPKKWGAVSEFNGVVLRGYRRGRVGVVLDFDLAQELKAKWLDSQKPPTHAKFLLLMVPRRYRETLVGDLEEGLSDAFWTLFLQIHFQSRKTCSFGIISLVVRTGG